jgi:putative Ca2+/H+ antiporter (TMEM165/GDT1 family)
MTSTLIPRSSLAPFQPLELSIETPEPEPVEALEQLPLSSGIIASGQIGESVVGQPMALLDAQEDRQTGNLAREQTSCQPSDYADDYSDDVVGGLSSAPLTEGAEAIETPCSKGSWALWRVAGSTFLTIFFAELGDKTQITTLLITAESHAPWVVFAGASTALICTSLLGVLLGQWLAQHVSPRVLDRSAGAMLLVVAVLLIWDVMMG